MSLLILGLGNPGSNFFYTRHNVGFLLLDSIASVNGLNFKKAKRYEYAEFKLGIEKIILVKPLTYMNLSGDVFPSVFSKFYVKRENLLVVLDNVDLTLGKCRLRKSGGSSTHNGLRSISHSLGTSDYSRLYIGVGNQEHKDIKDFVLSKFSSLELEILAKIWDFLGSEIIYLNDENFDEKILKINSSSFDVR